MVRGQTFVLLINWYSNSHILSSADYDFVDTSTIGDGELEGAVWGAAINDSKHGIYGTNYLSFSVKSCVPIGQSSLVYVGAPPNLGGCKWLRNSYKKLTKNT